jgi:excinuclease ABC subunit C
MNLRPTKKSLSRAPQTIGVYLFKNRREILYIGKSVNLKARLLSHLENARYDAKERAIIEGATHVQTLAAPSEFKALILESKLIQKHEPRFNKIWRDDKSYLYIKITVKDAYPKVLLTRKENDSRSRYFGPFSSIRIAETLLREIRKVIPFCAAKSISKHPCFLSKIGLCNPCPSEVESIKGKGERKKLRKLYRKNIARVVKVLEGRTAPVFKNLYRELKDLSRQERFEEAIALRNRIFAFERLVSERVGLERGAESSKDAQPEEALRVLLAHYFPALPPLRRIECYDISNTGGREATAAMVVATRGQVDKSQYRKFRMKNPKLRSDFDMLAETLTRRFRNRWARPDLLVVDGGKPQVRTTLAALARFGVTIPVVGLAKNPDRLVLGIATLPTERLSLHHSGFNLLRLLRDEAHRFSKKYHTSLRDAKLRR